MTLDVKNVKSKLQSLVDPPNHSSTNCSWKIQMNSVKKNPEFKPEVFEFIEHSSSLLLDKFQFKSSEPEINSTLPSTYLHNKVSTASCSPYTTQITPSFM